MRKWMPAACWQVGQSRVRDLTASEHGQPQTFVGAVLATFFEDSSEPRLIVQRLVPLVIDIQGLRMCSWIAGCTNCKLTLSPFVQAERAERRCR